MAQHLVTLDGETDWPGFRREARALIASLVPPEQVHWCTGQDAGLFAAMADPAQEGLQAVTGSQPLVPPSFVALCKATILHTDAERFALLYRLLWRLVHEPGLRNDPLDPDRLRAQRMARAVRNDMHKMTAYVRFRAVDERDGESPLHVAWFEPVHHVVEAVAPFFIGRFARMRWAILTPLRSIRWNGEVLECGPGAARGDAPPPDAGEALWLTYYRHTFNPARLNLARMRSEMPRRYWHNLPESPLIDVLARTAPMRSTAMLDAQPSVPSRRIPITPHGMHGKASSMAGAPALPDDLEDALRILREATEQCRECPIGAHATQSVFGEGPAGASVMVVGEQPGDQEDLQGRPFVGPAGRLFDQAVAELGWSREQLYVTNAVKHFKFELRGKRRMHKTPAQREVAACLHWLEAEIAQVRPRALIALGATAARALLGRPVAVMRERGRWHTGARGLPVLVTLHPSALLRGDPAERDSAYARWLEDLAQAGEYLAQGQQALQKR